MTFDCFTACSHVYIFSNLVSEGAVDDTEIPALALWLKGLTARSRPRQKIEHLVSVDSRMVAWSCGSFC